MRTELELIEKIEKYLNNELAPSDQQAFEEQINSDPNLAREVKLQQETMKGIERAALKKEAQAAGTRFRRTQRLKKWGLAALILITVITAFIIYRSLHSHQEGDYKTDASGYIQGEDSLQLPDYNEAGERQWARPDSLLPAQLFSIDASKDTVIETKGGIVLSVPANGFMYANGEAATGLVQLVIKEALTAASIIQAGLSTTSGDRLLETGGMFFIDARKGAQPLKIVPGKNIYTAVPADTLKPGMMLFKGNRTDKGGIDWTNPIPIASTLMPADIHSLDFYPPDYLTNLFNLNYSTNKIFTDSLYYSFAYFFDEKYLAEQRPVIAETPGTDTTQTDSSAGHFNEGFIPTCGINPASVKAIWSDQFQNTLLATKEFEERMRWIHISGDNNVLRTYVNNLDKDLYYADSLVAAALSVTNNKTARQFSLFAARHQGKVAGRNVNAAKLAAYFYKKTTAYTKAIEKTNRGFWGKQAALDKKFEAQTRSYQQDSIKRMQQNFEREVDLNLKEAWRQLGYDTTIPRAIPPTAYFVEVTNTGWNNVDRYVIESVRAQTTLDYTDERTGKKAVINYNPVFFQIEQDSSFDNLSVYLLPDKLNSFIRLKDSSGIYTGKLNELMKYDMVCVGQKAGRSFFFSINNVTARTYSTITLQPVSEAELMRKLNTTASKEQAEAIQKEESFLRLLTADQPRQIRNEELIRLRDHLWKIIFPCAPDTKKIAPVDTTGK